MYHPIVEEDLNGIVSADYPWHRLAGKTVAVTGANGLVPAYLVETLLLLNNHTLQNDKVKVVAMVRDVRKAAIRFAHHVQNKQLQFLPIDLSQPIDCTGSVDFIVHGASPANPRFYTKSPSELFITNGLGTFHLFQLAHQKRCEQFLFISSGEVYGKLDPSQLPVPESVFGAIDPMRVRSCMAESKRFAENMSACLGIELGITAKVARLCHTFGPGMRLDDGRVFADFLGDLLAESPIRLKSDGTAKRTFCYLADATEAMFAILFYGKPGEAYNVAAENCTTTIGALAELLASEFGNGQVLRSEKSEPLSISPGKEIWPDSTPNPSKVMQLGWRSKTSLKDAFGRTLTYLKAQHASE